LRQADETARPCSVSRGSSPKQCPSRPKRSVCSQGCRTQTSPHILPRCDEP
jgi:hypothetical protein